MKGRLYNLVKSKEEIESSELFNSMLKRVESTGGVQIDGKNLLADSVYAKHIVAGEITSDLIDAGAITADKIHSGAITTDKLDANAITADKIHSGAITTEKLDADAITADKIKAGSITTEELATDAVTADKIKGGTITADELSAGAITADMIKTGILRSSNNVSEINMSNGTFSFANGKINYNGYSLSINVDSLSIKTNDVSSMISAADTKAGNAQTAANRADDKANTASGKAKDAYDLADAADTRSSSNLGRLKNAVTTIDRQGVTVKDGSFFLEDDSSDNKYSIVASTNLLRDHSFELTPPERRPNGDWVFDNMGGVYIESGDGILTWETKGRPSMYTGKNSSLHDNPGMFGLTAAVVDSSNYVQQAIPVNQNNYSITFSAYYRGSSYGTNARPYIIVGAYRYRDGGLSPILIGNTRSKMFPAVTSRDKMTRYSLTVDLADIMPNSYVNEGNIYVVVSYRTTSSSQKVMIDGTQAVVGDTMTSYDPEISLFETMGGVKGNKADRMNIDAVNFKLGRIYNVQQDVNSNSDSDSFYLEANTGTNLRIASGNNIMMHNNVNPSISSKFFLGNAGYRWEGLYIGHTGVRPPSDARIKDKIEDVPDELARIFENQVNEKTYFVNGVKQTGYLAQDVEAALFKYATRIRKSNDLKEIRKSAELFDMVEKAEGYLNLNYRQVFVIKQRGKDLRIKELEDKNNSLEKRIEKIEDLLGEVL